MILPRVRDKRFITVRRGGSLSDPDHFALALWAAKCSERVLPYFDAVSPSDERPRLAIAKTSAWVRGEITMQQARDAAFHANAAAAGLAGAARFAAYSAGQAVAVAHVAAHYLGAAAYAIKAVRWAQGGQEGSEPERDEWHWQIEQVPPHLLALVLEDQRNRNSICWNAFAPAASFTPS